MQVLKIKSTSQPSKNVQANTISIQWHRLDLRKLGTSRFAFLSYRTYLQSGERACHRRTPNGNKKQV